MATIFHLPSIGRSNKSLGYLGPLDIVAPFHTQHLFVIKSALDLPNIGRFRIVRMNIGQAAKTSGVNAKLIRHYESLGIIPKASRSEAGYRQYSENDVHILTFVRRSRSLGFSMKEIKKLVSLWRNRTRASADVKSMTLSHIKNLEEKINDLQAIRATLLQLANHCHGDDRPTCPILEDLSKS